MNYLAHVYLAGDSPELITGGMLGDFVKGSFQNLYTPGIRNGIDLHRRIDSYTDHHEVVYASKRMIAPPRRRFAGIMVDLFYDHFLAKNWSTYSSCSLDDFSQRVYQILLEKQEILPPALGKILPYMIKQNWLNSYQEISQIGQALNGISRRLKRQNPLVNSVEELEWHYTVFEKDFQHFFPDLINFAQTYSVTHKP